MLSWFFKVQIRISLSAIVQPLNEFVPTTDESTSWLSRPNIFVTISKVFQMNKRFCVLNSLSSVIVIVTIIVIVIIIVIVMCFEQL